MLMLERHKYSVLSTAQHPQLYTPHTSLHRLSHAHTTPVTATHTGTHAHSHRPPAATCRNTALPPAHRSSSSSDTSPRGPMSVELSRPSQNTQDLMVAETPRLHDTHLPGVSPFRGAGSGRRQPGQGSTLSPSDSADSESGHLPLTEPQTFLCTPDPYPGLADDVPCQSLLRAKSGKALTFMPGGPQSCAVAVDWSWPPCLHARPGGVRSGVLGWQGAAAGPVVIAWQPEAHPTRCEDRSERVF